MTVLCRALSNRDLASNILALIEKDPHSVQQPNDDGSYPLHLACMNNYNYCKEGGRYDTVIRKLVSLFPKALQYKDKTGRTPLHVAIYNSCTTDVISELVQQHTPAVQEIDDDGNYPLHLACSRSHWCHEVVGPLIDSFPWALQHVNKHGRYPLHIAIGNQSIEVVMKLIKLFPMAIEHKDNDGYYPLHRACQWRSCEELTMKLIEVFPFAATQKTVASESFPLHLACDCRQSITVVRQLVEIYPQALKEMEYNGWYPIHNAAYTSKIRRAKPELIKYMSDIDPTLLNLQLGQDGQTALHLICRQGYLTGLFQDLVGYPELSINLKDKYGMTALHIACCEGIYSNAVALLQHPNININIEDKRNETPLHKLLQQHRPIRLVKLLIDSDRLDLKKNQIDCLMDKINSVMKNVDNNGYWIAISDLMDTVVTKRRKVIHDYCSNLKYQPL
jgi:ankyrin repeat protein